VVVADPFEVDRRVRLAAFEYLESQTRLHGDVLPRVVLTDGFVHAGGRVRLVGPQGIFKPQILQTGVPLTVTTAPPVEGRDRPYEDEVGQDGLLRYRYRGTDPAHHENVGLRRAMRDRIPLIYFHGITPGWYVAQWPVFIVGDDPGALTFTIAVDDPLALQPGLDRGPVEDARRSYMTRLARQRLHQAAFRHRVLRAYRSHCTVCSLRHAELLDAAHILPDGHPLGEPVTSNGLALCKLHHTAFDVGIIGIRPDLVVEVRRDVLDEIDGPMLRHGLQGFEGGRLLVLPQRAVDRPNEAFLAERYEAFRQAG
jgi:putative restriction endonuclease